MIIRKHKLFIKAICALCAFSLQFNAFASCWSDAWSSVCDATKKAARETGEWISSHQEEIIATVTLVAAIAVACNCEGGADFSSAQTAPGGYSYTTSHSQEGAYKPFTQAQKADILQQNRERNGGVLRSDYSGKVLEEPHRYTKGYTPSPNEAQVDHINPRSRGGWNSAENAQVHSREENLRKSDNANW